MKPEHIYYDEMGCARDRIVERMFHDLDTGSWNEDLLTESNFKVYCDVVYGATITHLIEDAEFFSIANMAALAADLFGIIIIQNLGKTMPEKAQYDGKIHACRNHAWGDKTLYASHAELNMALALMIVQDMRFEIIRRFAATETKQ